MTKFRPPEVNISCFGPRKGTLFDPSRPRKRVFFDPQTPKSHFFRPQDPKSHFFWPQDPKSSLFRENDRKRSKKRPFLKSPPLRGRTLCEKRRERTFAPQWALGKHGFFAKSALRTPEKTLFRPPDPEKSLFSTPGPEKSLFSTPDPEKSLFSLLGPKNVTFGRFSLINAYPLRFFIVFAKIDDLRCL